MKPAKKANGGAWRRPVRLRTQSGYHVALQGRVCEWAYWQLRELAIARETSLSELTRTAVHAYLAAEGRPVPDCGCTPEQLREVPTHAPGCPRFIAEAER